MKEPRDRSGDESRGYADCETDEERHERFALELGAARTLKDALAAINDAVEALDESGYGDPDEPKAEAWAHLRSGPPLPLPYDDESPWAWAWDATHVLGAADGQWPHAWLYTREDWRRMLADDEEGGRVCPGCSGSGEGMSEHRACPRCKGSGSVACGDER